MAEAVVYVHVNVKQGGAAEEEEVAPARSLSALRTPRPQDAIRPRSPAERIAGDVLRLERVGAGRSQLRQRRAGEAGAGAAIISAAGRHVAGKVTVPPFSVASIVQGESPVIAERETVAANGSRCRRPEQARRFAPQTIEAELRPVPLRSRMHSWFGRRCRRRSRRGRSSRHLRRPPTGAGAAHRGCRGDGRAVAPGLLRCPTRRSRRRGRG